MSRFSLVLCLAVLMIPSCWSSNFCSPATGVPCCGNVTFNPATQTCCSGVLHQGEGTCCGTDMYVNDDDLLWYYGCCGETVFVDDNEHDCCGKTVFNPQTQMCCGGVPITPSETQRCCRGVIYNPRESTCCGGVVQPGRGKCCGKTVYEPSETKACCNSRRGTFYDPTKETCCSGVVLEGLGSCCGRTLYTPSYKESCCGNRWLFNPQEQKCCSGTVVSGFGICCGTHLYTASSGFKCCGGELYKPPQLCCDGVVHDVYVQELIACCGNVTYNQNYETCCSGVVVDGYNCPKTTTTARRSHPRSVSVRSEKKQEWFDLTNRQEEPQEEETKGQQPSGAFASRMTLVGSSLGALLIVALLVITGLMGWKMHSQRVQSLESSAPEVSMIRIHSHDSVSSSSSSSSSSFSPDEANSSKENDLMSQSARKFESSFV